jgi:hypothetical protein
MFNSLEAVVSLPCGHYLHRTCYDEYIMRAYQCPVCKKSAINMELHWRKLEDEIASQPMPPRWRGTIVEVRCNDCGGKSRCNYHWLGCRCALCDSFNTVEVQIIGREGENGVTSTATENNSVRNPNSTTRRSLAAVPQPRARRYLQEDEAEASAEQGAAAALGLVDGTFGLGNTAYEMLARMSRSLSPLRHYFDSDGEENGRVGMDDGPATEAELEELGFWSDEDGEEDDDDEDDEDEEFDEDDEEDDYEDSESEDGELDLRLTGHR